MKRKTVSMSARRAERKPAKVASVIRAKGYPSGKLPKGKVLHHVKPVALGGKTTTRNTRIVTATKHRKIHVNRRKAGGI